MLESIILTAQMPHLMAQSAAPGGPGMESLLFPILLMVGMYFLIIAPQMKKQKEHQKMISELKPGQKIVTSGGIYGTIQKVEDKTFIVKVGEKQTLEIGKAFVHATQEQATKEEDAKK